MDKHHGQHCVVYIRPDLFRSVSRRLPVWSGDATVDRCVKCVNGWFGIRLEQTAFDLKEHVANRLGFFSQLHREGRFKV